MDLLLSEEQRMLQESARRFLSGIGGVERLRRLRETEHGFDRNVLRQMAVQGWLGMLVPAEQGGLGLGMTEAALVLEQAGRALAPEPAAASIMAAAALASCDGNEALLARAVAGDALVVPAVDAGPGAGEVRAILVSDGGVALEGSRLGVPAASAADGMLVAASGPDGSMLCHVEAGAKGLGIETRRTVDGASFGDRRIRRRGGSPLWWRGRISVSAVRSLSETACSSWLRPSSWARWTRRSR